MHHFLVRMYILQGKSLAMIFVYQKINALKKFFFLKIWPHCPICNLCVYIQSYSTLCHPVDCSPPGSSVHGIFQAWILEWVVISSSRGFSWPRDWTPVSCISCIGGRFFTSWATGEAPALCGDFTILHLQRICLRMPGSLQPCHQNSLLKFGMCQCGEIDYSLVIFVCIFLFMSEVECFFIWLRPICILLFAGALCHQFLVLAMPLFKGKLPAWLSIAPIYYSLLIQLYF